MDKTIEDGLGLDLQFDMEALASRSDENHAKFSPDFSSSPFLADVISPLMMDAESDALLHIFDITSLEDGSAPSRVDRDGVGGEASGGDGIFGTSSGTGGTPSILSEFTSSTVHSSTQSPSLVHHDQHTMDIGDFSIFGDKPPGSDVRREENAMSAPAGSAQGNANSVNFDALQQLLSMQMQMQYPMNVDGSMAPCQPGTSNSQNTTVLLEQQLRLQQLQQLQQLQNQIFQQQIELISGQTSLSNSLESTPMTTPGFRDGSQFQGLPTPANSTELRPQPPPSFVSPMILQNYLAQSGPGARFNNPPQQLPQGPSSAPAHLAFSTPQLVSPGDIDFDLSPLTSPWLEAVPSQQAQQQLRQHLPPEQGQEQGQRDVDIRPEVRGRRGSKRGASSGAEDVNGQARKRLSGIARTAATGGVRRPASARGSASVGSTPAIRAQSSRNSIANEIVGDTPSPVDLSMPPPSDAPQAAIAASVDTQRTPPGPPNSSASGSSISPVTPASIMNLGRLGQISGLSPHLSAVDEQRGTEKTKGKAKSKTPPKAAGPASSTSGLAPKTISKRRSTASLVSPSLKPLLPGGLAPSSAAALGSASNYTHHLSGSATALRIAPSSPLPPPTPTVRKSSHKAAEQKRRDSLKTTFDVLRTLLPPLPLPSEEGYSGEAPLPGANPPRGPPRGDVQGPNRAVSKLQLLRAGNDFIRRLQGRVARRDEYIEQLKREVKVLRAKVEAKEGGGAKIGDGDVETTVGGVGGEANVDMDGMTNEFEKVDLEKDLDAEEENASRLGAGLLDVGEDADEDYD